jgi:hypothetical protein
MSWPRGPQYEDDGLGLCVILWHFQYLDCIVLNSRMTDELERAWKEVAVAQSKCHPNLPGRTEEIHEEPQ